MNEIYEQMVQHIVTMAKTQGWLDHARLRAKELEKCESGLFSGIVAEVRKRLESSSKQP